MNQLLKSKTLFKKGVGVELFQGGSKLWGVKVYRITNGVQVSTARFSVKSTAERYYAEQEDTDADSD